MSDDSLDPERVRRAKELAAGPQGEAMAKLPLRYAAAAFIVQPGVDSSEPIVRNGTVSLVDFGSGPIGVTCSHVLDEYRQRLDENEQTVFLIGNLQLDPLEALIYESKELDLVTIDLRRKKTDQITNGGEIGSNFYRPQYWPQRNIAEGDFVALGGFPGKWRIQASPRELDSGTFSVYTPVTSVRHDYFVCQFERGDWVESLRSHYLRPFDTEGGTDLHDLGGLSGGPVFIFRDVYWEFVGIIYQFSPQFDLLYARPTRFISESGSILATLT